MVCYLRRLAATLAEGRHCSEVVCQVATETVYELLVNHPFDPNERFWMPVGTHETTLLTEVLRYTASPAQPATDLAWPTDLQAFNDALFAAMGRTQVDREWIAAALAAAGADPWVELDGTAPTQVPYPVRTAASHGYTRLLDRFLDKPSAWGAALVWGDGSLWNDEAHLPLAHRLLARGCFPPDPVALLTHAHPKVMEAVVRAGAGPSTSRERRRLLIAWRKTRPVLCPANRVKLRLWHQAVSAGASLNTLTVPLAHALGVEFELKNSRGALPLLGEEAWSERCLLNKGPLSGTWGWLGAAAVEQLHSFSIQGHNRYLRRCLTKTLRAPFVGTPWAPALGIQWRPNVALDGLVALVVLGTQKNRQNNRPILSSYVDQSSPEECLELFRRATGLTDLSAWWQRHILAAVALTQALVSSQSIAEGDPCSAAAKWSLAEMWAEMVDGYPVTKQTLDPARVAALLSSLTVITQPPCGVTPSDFAAFAPPHLARLANALCPSPDQDGAWSLPPGPRREVALWARLAQHPMSALLDSALAEPEHVTPDDLAWLAQRMERIEELWGDSSSEPKETCWALWSQLNKQVNRCRLECSLPTPSARTGGSCRL